MISDIYLSKAFKGKTLLKITCISLHIAKYERESYLSTWLRNVIDVVSLFVRSKDGGVK